MKEFLAYAVIAALVVIALAPPRYDPAIRLKKLLERQRKQK